MSLTASPRSYERNWAASMLERTEMTFGELGELFDGPHATPTRTKDGPFFLNISSLNDGRLDLNQSDHVSDEEFTKWTRRVTPEAGDLLFSYETRLGEAALMPSGVKACLGRRMALLRPNRLAVEPAFLLYYYLSPEFQELIAQHTIHGATVNRIGLSTMPNWPLALPKLEEQRAIAEVLGALDDKIAANSRVAATARMLQTAEFTRLMSVVGCPSTIKEVLSLEYGKPLLAQNRRDGDVDVFGSGGIVGSHNEAFATGPGIVVGRKGTAGSVHWAPRGYYPIDTTFFVSSSDADIYSMIFCYHLLKSVRLSEQNSDSAVPGLNRNDAHAIKFRLPNQEAIRQFTETAMPQANLAMQIDQDSVALAAMRDALLPQLMSGKLRVKDAEKSLAGVL